MSPTNAHVVTAVIVAHDGAAWIPRLIQALQNQTRPLQRVVAVDTGSRDRSGAMLAQALGRGAVFGMDRTTGYGAAVHQALRHRAASTYLSPAVGQEQEEPAEWVWLLHDDCEPEPDALEELLLGVDRAPGTAVVGPKLMDWADRNVLLEAGVTIDRRSRRITGLEPREVDQGQHDGDRDVLAVSSAAMLVRRDVWDRVGGFDPGLVLYREDVDFCWRVQAAGHRVRAITDAVVYHAEASARNRRPASAAPRRGRPVRRDALLALVGNLPARPMFSALLGNLVLSALRTAFFLVAKRPGAAADELTAFVSVAGHPLRLLSFRRRRAPGRRAAYSRLRTKLPPGRSLRKLAEFAVTAMSKSGQADTVGSHHALQDPSDDESLLVDSGLLQHLLTSPSVLLFLGLTTVTLVAARSLLAGSPLGGGALVPAWGGAAALWHEYLQGFHPAGIGTSAATPPYVVPVAALATLLGGKPWLAVDVILIGCVPFSGLTAFLASRRVTRYVPARVWAAATYALLPVGMGAVAAGRLGAAVAEVLLPLAAVSGARVFTETRARARRAAWATALIVAVMAAFVPLAWPVAVIAMAVAALALGRRAATALNAGIVALVPGVLLLPWSAGLFTQPSRLLLGAGLQPPGLASPGLSARSLLLLSPGGPGLPPVWVTAGLVVAAVVVLLAAGRRALVLAGWGAALTGLVISAAVSRAIVAAVAGNGPVHAWPGVALVFAGAGLSLAVAAVGDGLSGRLRSGGWRRPRGLALLVLAAVAWSAPAAAAASWVTSGVRGPVAPVAGPVLPEFVSVSSATGLRLRTLVLRGSLSGGIRFSVLRAASPLLGSPQLTTPPAARRALDRTVAALTAPHGNDVQDPGRSLARFDIGYVLVPSHASAGLVSQLDGVAGLRPVSKTAVYHLWQVVVPTARVTVTEPGGTVVPLRSGPVSVTRAKAPAKGGTLILAEPAGGWHATLNGHPLTPLASPVDGWAQGFRLPAGGGSISITHSETGRYVAVALEAAAVMVVAGLGLPGARAAGGAEEAGEGSPAAGQGPRRSRGRSRGRRPSRRSAAAPDAVSPAVRASHPQAPAQGGPPGTAPGRLRAGRRGRGRPPAGPPPGGGPAEAMPDGERGHPGGQGAVVGRHGHPQGPGQDGRSPATGPRRSPASRGPARGRQDGRDGRGADRSAPDGYEPVGAQRDGRLSGRSTERGRPGYGPRPGGGDARDVPHGRLPAGDETLPPLPPPPLPAQAPRRRGAAAGYPPEPGESGRRRRDRERPDW